MRMDRKDNEDLLEGSMTKEICLICLYAESVAGFAQWHSSTDFSWVLDLSHPELFVLETTTFTWI